MKCPQCQEENKQSRVYPGASSTTLAYYPPYYDEDGKLHDHDNNIITTDCRCSNEHEWTEKSNGSCWCGWKG